MTPTPEADAFGKRLREAREAKGLHFPDVVFELRSQWPKSLHTSASTLSRLERGAVPEADANPSLVSALAAIYDVPLKDLSEVARAALDLVIARGRCNLQQASQQRAA